MPIFLVTGPFLSDLSVVIIDLAFLIIIFKEKKQFYVLNNKYFKFLIILWIYFSLIKFPNIRLKRSSKLVIFLNISISPVKQ